MGLFLTIIGSIRIGFIVLIALFAGTLISATCSANAMLAVGDPSFRIFISFLNFVVAVFYFLPTYNLNKFASNAQAVLRDNDSEVVITSFGYLKSH